MTWIYAAVALGVAGLVPLVVLTARLLVSARRLAGEIERAASRLEPVRDRLRAAIAASGRQEG
ncbi:hypothetical protein ABGB17_14270 [Sphaerisporangium sp. B11E5]|uniref:hypothetical protein n=1 Tax=Sphaerisporangium sp. B11E5 TaxID=3153563 RepID=UPI00325E36F0